MNSRQTAHSIRATGLARVSGEQLDAANDMRAELQFLADEIKARDEAGVRKPVLRTEPAPRSEPRWVSTCTLCGERSTAFVCGSCAAWQESTGRMV